MTWLRLHLSSVFLRIAAMLVATLVLAACRGNSQEHEATPSPGLVERGAALYAANCSRCHGFDHGGSLKDIPPPHNANGHTWHHPDQQLIEVTLNGIDFAVEGQPRMPPFKGTLNESDVRAILAYIKTWWTEEQTQWQTTVTAQATEQQ